MGSTVPTDLLKLLRHEVALITVKTARAGLHPLLHQRFSTGMNKELPGQCNRATRSRDNHCGACICKTSPVVPPAVSHRHVLDW